MTGGAAEGWPTGPNSVPCIPQHLSSGQEVLEAEQDSLALCLLGLGLRLQDQEQGLGPWASAQSRMGQLQVGSGRPRCGRVSRASGVGASFLGWEMGLFHVPGVWVGKTRRDVTPGPRPLVLLGVGVRVGDGGWCLTLYPQALQADLRGAAERVDALLAFGEGLAQRSGPRAQASLEQVLRALRAHRGSIFRRLWWLEAQLVSSSLVWPTLAGPAPGTNSTPPMTLSSDQVFEEASPLDQDLEVEGDLDGPGPGGIWGPWAPSSYPTPAELEWDPAGDVGGLRPLGQKTAWTPGAPCELCGHRGPQGRGQGLEVRAGGGYPLPHRHPWDTSVCLLLGYFLVALSLPQSLSVSLSLLLSQCCPPSLPPSPPASLGLCVFCFPSCGLYLHFPIAPALPHSPLCSHVSLLVLHSKVTPISKPPDSCPFISSLHSSLSPNVTKKFFN